MTQSTNKVTISNQLPKILLDIKLKTSILILFKEKVTILEFELLKECTNLNIIQYKEARLQKSVIQEIKNAIQWQLIVEVVIKASTINISHLKLPLIK